jgi:nickel transport protein
MARLPMFPSPLRPAQVAAGLLCGVCALAAAPAARSHAIESSLERLSALNDQLLLESRFGNGEPASDAVVRLVPPGGQPVEVGRTDGQGRLNFQLPSQASADWEVQVDGGPGHRDYLELPASSGPAAQVESQPRLPLAAAAVGRAPLLAVGLLGLGGLGLGGLKLVRRRR